MKSKLSRKVIEEKIEGTLSKNPSPKETKKLKVLAMSKNVKLGKFKKKFCKKCFSLFTSETSEIRIKDGMKIIKCKVCGNINRWKLKKEPGQYY